jgi:predicted HicB family RNase H-like nuclease
MGKKAKKISEGATGRPRKYGKQLTSMRSLRFPDEDYEKWQAAADASGLSLTEWIVNACRKALARSPKAP